VVDHSGRSHLIFQFNFQNTYSVHMNWMEFQRWCTMLRMTLLLAVVAGQSEACTSPHTSEDSRRPYCFVPDTVSWQAQKLLKTKHVTTDLPPGIPAAAVQAIHNSRAAARAVEADAAASAFFTKGSVTNATVAGSAGHLGCSSWL